ncbi:MAG: InlB B-repeat-containing protein, partial [Oscillibacter sp.]|nr:InlB B-repeat-containing protein [Oscillibacter sp.]
MNFVQRICKGALILFLTLCAALVMTPGARAADTYGLYVGGVEITSDNLTVSGDSGTATYDPDTHTLTLNNYSYTGAGYENWGEGGGIDYRGGDLRIVLKGSNSIVKSADSSPDRSHGIYFNGGTLTISGEGSLDISFAAASSGIWKRNGIFCEPGAFVMESGTVTTAGGTAQESAGIYTSSGITINGGTFTGIGNPTTNYESRGIYSGSITINAGTVTAQATNSGYEALAFDGGVTVNGGEVTASASSDSEAKAFSSSCAVAGELLEMKVGDSAETAVATTNPGDASGKKYAYIKAKPLPRYTATFDANGGEGAMDAISGLKGHQITLPANAFAAPMGKIFNGWSDGETAYQPGEAYTFAADVTFSAVWADAVTVTFDSNGGGAVDSQTIPINANAVKPKAPAKDGFIFRGWELDGTPYDFSAPVAQDITLTASWLEGFSVAADFEDGAFPDGWTQEGNGSWSVGTGDGDGGGAHTGNGNARRIDSDGSGNESWLIMPAQDLSGKTAASLSFWYINRDWGGDTDAFGAYYRVNGGDWAELFATTEGHGSWTEWSDDLPNAALTANVQIGFKMTDNFGFGVGLDDVSLESGGHSWAYAAEGAAITATCQNDPCALGESKSLSLTLTESDGAVSLDGLDAFNAATGLAVSESDIQYYSGETLLSEAPSEVGSYAAKLTVGGVTAEKAFQILGPVKYQDAQWNDTTKTVDFTEQTCEEYTPVTSGLTAWNAGWYVVNSNVTISERVNVTGTVNLILCDGATLNAGKGITVQNSDQLTIYAQSGGTGALSATASGNEEAGIGAYHSNNGSSNCGTVTIKGGVIEARGNNGAGIGGAGGNSGGGNITIYGGSVTAVGQAMNTGIGSGWRPYGSTSVTIYGGEINATGGQRAAGIGGGTSASNITVKIYGGVINATGGSQNSAGIGYGDDSSGRHIIVAIDGGDVTASGVVAIGAHSTNETIALTVADSLTVKAGDDAASAVMVSTSDFIASHTQKYARIALLVPTIDAQTETLAGWTYGDTVAEADRTLSVTVSAVTGGALSYQWYVVAPETEGFSGTVSMDDGSGDTEPDEPAGTPISGAVSASYAVPDGTQTNAGTYQYYCVVSEEGAANTATSKSVSLTVAKATPQVTAPVAKTPTYNGAAQTLISAGSATGGTLVYSLTEDGDYVETLPEGTDAKTYAVWYKVNGGDNYNDVEAQSVSVTIAPKAATVTAAAQTVDLNGAIDTAVTKATLSDAVSGHTLTAVTLTSSATDNATTSGTITPSAATIKSGETDVTANYDITYKDGVLTVNKGTPTVTAPTANALTYNGAAQTLISAGSATGGTLVYSLTEDGEYVETLPEGTDAKTYAVWYKVNGGDNYNDVEAQSVSVTIAPKAATVTAAAQTVELGGAIDTAVTKATLSDAVSGHTLAAVTLTGSATDNATTSGTITPGAAMIKSGETDVTANYNITYKDGVLTVNKGTPTVTAPTANALTYNGAAQTLINAGSTTAGTLVYSLTQDGDYVETLPEGTDAKTYTVWYKVNGGDNYNDVAAQSVSVTIAPATLSITAAAQSKTYGETDPALTFTASGFVGDDTESVISGALSRATGENAGTYAIGQGTLAAGNNYAISFTGANLTINKATLTVKAAAQSKTYGEDDPELTFTASGFVGDDTESVISGALSRATGENAGTYAIGQGTLAAGNNYAISFTGANLTINKATLTVTADAQSKTYGEDDPELTYTASGFVGDDTESVINGALSRDAGENAGTYAIGQGTLAAENNYAISFTGAKFTITPATAPFAITLSETSYAYDGAAKKPAVTVKKGGLTVPAAEYTVAYADNINAGTATVTLTDVDGGNFTVSGKTTFTIASAEIAPSVTLDGWTYGETANAPSVTGNSGDGAVTYEYKLRGAEDKAYDSALPVTAGNYTVRASIAATDNYAAGRAEANFTIDKAPLTVTAKDGTITYGDAPRGFGVTYSGFVNKDGESVLSGTLAYAFDYAQYDKAGNYKITPSGLTAANYAIDFVNGVLTVEPKTIELIWGETDFTYDGAEKLPAASAKGLLNGDECAVTVTGGQTNAGNYTATASGLSNSNYKLPENNTVSFSVRSASIDVSAVNYSGVYDGAPHSPTVTVNSPSGVSIKYGTEEGAYSLDKCPALTNAGSLTVYYQATAENYQSVTGNATVTISKKPVTVSGITAADKPYDGKTDATLNYDNVTFDGIVTGDKLTVTATGTFENADVGNKKIVTITNL